MATLESFKATGDDAMAWGSDVTQDFEPEKQRLREIELVGTGGTRGYLESWLVSVQRTGERTIDRFIVDEPATEVTRDQKAEDRIALLIQKYVDFVSSTEDQARIDILNAQIDRETPRFGEEHLELMEKAETLLRQFSQSQPS